MQRINIGFYFPFGISLQIVIYKFPGLLRKEGENDWEVLNGRKDIIKIKSSRHTFETHGNYMRSILARQKLVGEKVVSRGMYFFKACPILRVG